MNVGAPAFEKHLFVCENRREEGSSCGEAGERIRLLLKQRVAASGLSPRVRVSRSGCLDVCREGPNVLLMPDNVWFSRVSEADLAAIVERAASGLSAQGGKP